MDRDGKASTPFDGGGRLAKGRGADHGAPLATPSPIPIPPPIPPAAAPAFSTPVAPDPKTAGSRNVLIAGVALLAVAFGAYRLGSANGAPPRLSEPTAESSVAIASDGPTPELTDGSTPDPTDDPMISPESAGEEPAPSEPGASSDDAASAPPADSNEGVPDPPAETVPEADSPAPTSEVGGSEASGSDAVAAVESALGDGWRRTRDEDDADGRRMRWTDAEGDAFVVLELHREPGWNFTDLRAKEEARLRATSGYRYRFVRYRGREEGSRTEGIWNYKLKRGAAAEMAKMLVGFPATPATPPILLHCSRDLTHDRSSPEGRRIVAAFDRAFGATNRVVTRAATQSE